MAYVRKSSSAILQMKRHFIQLWKGEICILGGLETRNCYNVERFINAMERAAAFMYKNSSEIMLKITDLLYFV